MSTRTDPHRAERASETTEAAIARWRDERDLAIDALVLDVFGVVSRDRALRIFESRIVEIYESIVSLLNDIADSQELADLDHEARRAELPEGASPLPAGYVEPRAANDTADTERPPGAGGENMPKTTTYPGVPAALETALRNFAEDDADASTAGALVTATKRDLDRIVVSRDTRDALKIADATRPNGLVWVAKMIKRELGAGIGL